MVAHRKTRVNESTLDLGSGVHIPVRMSSPGAVVLGTVPWLSCYHGPRNQSSLACIGEIGHGIHGSGIGSGYARIKPENERLQKQISN